MLKEKFLLKNRNYVFGPFVPLFIQWLPITAVSQTSSFTNSEYQRRWGVYATSPPEKKELIDVLAATLNRDLMYITVTEFDNSFGYDISKLFPNILVLGASAGHVPIPLFMGGRKPPAPRVPVKESRAVLSFAGSQSEHTLRPSLIASLEAEMGSMFDVFRTKVTEDWVTRLVQSSVALAPRGVGRGSFRLTEVLQLGMPAVYVYIGGDASWLPYSSVVSMPSGPVLAMPYPGPFSPTEEKLQAAKSIARALETLNDAYLEKLHRRALQLAETHFSQCALMRHISGFMAYGGEGGQGSDLECVHATPEF